MFSAREETLQIEESLQYVDLHFGCDSCESSFETVTELNNHYETHGTVHHDSQYGGGNLYDDMRFPVNTLGATVLDNIAESTRIETHKDHKYKCDECEFNSSYMDELLMHVNLNHRGDRDESSSYSSINVTVVDTPVECIMNLSRKRKVGDNCNRSNVKKMKYRLYD